jgi:hypothetical protein
MYIRLIVLAALICGGICPTIDAAQRRGFSLEPGLFFSYKWLNGDLDLATGRRIDRSLPEYGVSLGGTYQINDNNSVSMWTDAGIGDFSMVLISYVSLGGQYLRGNKVDSWAIGPAFGVNTTGIECGVGVYYKNWYVRPSIAGANWWVAPERCIATKLTAGYSFYFGR